MSLKPPPPTSSYTPISAGSHAAYLFSLVDMGTQEEMTNWGLKQLPKIRVGFEVPGETVEIDGNPVPATVFQEYTNSLGKKATWRHHIESWGGQPMTQAQIDAFDPMKLIGKKCMISVIHKTSKTGNVYAVVDNISQIPKGMQEMPDRKSTRLNSSHVSESRMPSSA